MENLNAQSNILLDQKAMLDDLMKKTEDKSGIGSTLQTIIPLALAAAGAYYSAKKLPKLVSDFATPSAARINKGDILNILSNPKGQVAYNIDKYLKNLGLSEII